MQRDRDEEADVVFLIAAVAEGWLKSDPHQPGDGRGLWAWYRENGIIPPEYLERRIPGIERTNWNWEGEPLEEEC